jgi:hypothetical protein
MLNKITLHFHSVADAESFVKHWPDDATPTQTGTSVTVDLSDDDTPANILESIGVGLGVDDGE